MFATDETPKAKKGVVWLIALAALMALIAICLAAAFAFNSASELHSFAAQDEQRGYRGGFKQQANGNQRYDAGDQFSWPYGTFGRRCGSKNRAWCRSAG